MSNQEVNKHPVSALPTFEELVTGMLDEDRMQAENFQQAREKPAVLDDAIVTRALSMYKERETFMPFYEEHFDRWEKESKNPDILKRISELRKKHEELKNLIQQILEDLDYIKDRTIDKVLNKSDFEIGRDFFMDLLNKDD
tara:strand:- start:1691 stop:2113 length:423 start_codon:yes stop_codon:yes gene_type:complete